MKKKIERKKRIVSLAFYTNQSGDVSEIFNSSKAILSMASDRMQFKPALDAAVNAGFTSEVFSLHSENYADILKIEPADICLVTKMSANTKKLNQSMVTANLAALTLLKSEGSKIVVQYCDNIFASTTNLRNDLIRFYNCIFEMADLVVFPCEKLKTMTATYLRKDVKTFVINDPWQLSEYHEPRKLVPDKRCRLVWFGNNKNVPYLLKALDQIFNVSPSKLKFLLTIIGRKEAHNITLEHIKKSGKIYPNWRVRFVEWSDTRPVKQLEEELSKSHISIIPSDPNDPLKAGVSHNRIVDSIRGGCVTIASPMDSYMEFKDTAILGDDFGKLLNQAIKEYEIYCNKISLSQATKLEKFNPEANKKAWKAFWVGL